ncbi:hypothetical protein ACFJGW_09575 [Burkholderiaceae bacterium UC74_6]
MSNDTRSAFQQQLVEALVESKAFNIAALGSTLSKFGERAALHGESIAVIINKHSIWACGNPGPDLNILQGGGPTTGP